MSEDVPEKISQDEILRLSVDIVSAYLSNNQLPSSQLPEVIQVVYATLDKVGDLSSEPDAEPQKPAVPVRRSVHPDYLVCLEDGKKLKMLKRHLRTNYDMTPEEYRAKWNLAPDYPMVAPNYAKQRSQFAKQIGLGRKTGKRGAARR